MPYPYSYAWHHHHHHHHPVPPPVHTDLCVPYDDSLLWKALEDLHKHLHELLDEERDQRKAADQALLDKIEQEIEDRIAGDEDLQDQIDEHTSYIENIYEVLSEILTGGSTTTLTRGVDYNITFYNGYKKADDAAEAFYVTDYKTVLTSPQITTTTHEIYFSSDGMTHSALNGKAALTNSHTITNGVSEGMPKFKHGNVALDYPDSWICFITFLGDYGDYINSQAGSSNIWNMDPNSQRATWNVALGSQWTNAVTGNYGLLIYTSSIADGYNSQYYLAYDNLTYAHLNTHMTINMRKEEKIA